MNRRVVVTGVGTLSPLGLDTRAFLSGLRAGLCGLGPITLFDVRGHRCRVGCEVKGFQPGEHFSRSELRRLDRASQFVLVATRQAVDDAGLDFSREESTRCGVVLGTTLGGMISGEAYHRGLKKGQPRPSLLWDFPLRAALDRVAVTYGLRGVNLPLSTACAAGTHAIGYAFDLIRFGRADVIIAGGFDALAEMALAGFGVLQVLTKGIMRPFDRGRDGFALGEGAGILILEEEARARRRGAKVYGEIVGYGITCDAYHLTAPDKEGEGMVRVMEAALREAQLAPEEVDYVNAHGTATRYNDAMEARALEKVLGAHLSQLPVSSTKPLTGHAMGASGAIEAVVCLLALRDRFLPPTLNYETPDPVCPLDVIRPPGRRVEQANIALSLSSAFAGNNAAVVFRRRDLD